MTLQSYTKGYNLHFFLTILTLLNCISSAICWPRSHWKTGFNGKFEIWNLSFVVIVGEGSFAHIYGAGVFTLPMVYLLLEEEKGGGQFDWRMGIVGEYVKRLESAAY